MLSRKQQPDVLRPGALASRAAGRRSAFTVPELAATLILLGALMSAAMPLLRAIKEQRRASDRRLIATQEVANLMERFSAQPWNRIAQPEADKLALSATANEALREPKLKVTVEPVSTQPPSKRIHIEVRWKNRVGDFVSPLRLTAFVYHHEEPK